MRRSLATLLVILAATSCGGSPSTGEVTGRVILVGGPAGHPPQAIGGTVEIRRGSRRYVQTTPSQGEVIVPDPVLAHQGIKAGGYCAFHVAPGHYTVVLQGGCAMEVNIATGVTLHRDLRCDIP